MVGVENGYKIKKGGEEVDDDRYFHKTEARQLSSNCHD